ncbi:MAG: hypothetical protein HY056_13515 [Proteobacteria bacterium]|nr:hypothetical protein [Pseudomonadota bacterium]
MAISMLAFAGGVSAQAQSRYDGVWSVVIVTERGTCDRAYRYPVRIARGIVGHGPGADTAFNISGRVGRGGSVHVSVKRGGQGASGHGRLSRDTGSGRWKSSSNECSGYWTAERRG